MTATNINLELIEGTVKKSRLNWTEEEKTEWKKAFDFYNLNHARELKMTCSPCYVKVLQFLREV